MKEKIEIMKINKKQLIEQLRYLAEHDQGQLKEIIKESLHEASNNILDAEVAYLSSLEIKKQQIQIIRAENFKRFGEVYKALS